MKTAETIAAMSLPAAMMTKESINRAYETTLAEGIRFERRVFHAMFATVPVTVVVLSMSNPAAIEWCPRRGKTATTPRYANSAQPNRYDLMAEPPGPPKPS